MNNDKNQKSISQTFILELHLSVNLRSKTKFALTAQALLFIFIKSLTDCYLYHVYSNADILYWNFAMKSRIRRMHICIDGKKS